MAIPFQLDTSIPMSYKPGPSVLEQASSIMSLADMMDQRKFRQAEIERLKKERESDLELGKTLSKLYAPVQTPQVQTPVQPSIQSTQTPIQPSIQPTQIPSDQETVERETFDQFLDRRLKEIKQPDQTPIQPIEQPVQIPIQPIQPVPVQAPIQPVQPLPEQPQISMELSEEEKDAVAKAYSTGGYAKGSAFYDRILKHKSNLLESEKLSQEIKKLRGEASTRETDLLTKQFELDKQKAGRIANAMYAIDDPIKDYPLIVREARRLGIGADRVPDQYDPQAVDQFVNENRPIESQVSEKKSLRDAEKAKKETVFNQEKDLRDKFSTLTKDYVAVRDSYKRINSLQASPAGDMGLIFNIMKMFDPGSTVRESEYATAQNAGSVPTRIVSLYNSVIQGTKLTPEQRADFKNTAENLMRGQSQTFGQLKNYYENLATQYELDPKKITGGIEINLPKKKSIIRSKEEEAALKWAKENPNNPDAKWLLQQTGGE